MNTKLLLSMVRMVMISTGGMIGGTANVWAACTATPNCESMGYKYCESECPNGSIACPFDSSKRFCFSPKPYSVAASTCSSQCKNVGSKSCTKNGTVYYESCGSNKCGTGYTCTNGSCISTCKYSYTAASCSSQCKSVGSTSCVKDGTTYYSSCGSSKCSSGQTCTDGTCVSPAPVSGYCCGYNGCSPDENWCQNHYSKNCYRVCTENNGLPDCGDMQASCVASGGTPRFQICYGYDVGMATFGCY